MADELDSNYTNEFLSVEAPEVYNSLHLETLAQVMETDEIIAKVTEDQRLTLIIPKNKAAEKMQLETQGFARPIDGTFTNLLVVLVLLSKSLQDATKQLKLQLPTS